MISQNSTNIYNPKKKEKEFNLIIKLKRRKFKKINNHLIENHKKQNNCPNSILNEINNKRKMQKKKKSN